MVVDNKWTDHIDALDQLRNAVGLRGYDKTTQSLSINLKGSRCSKDMIGAIEYDVAYNDESTNS